MQNGGTREAAFERETNRQTLSGAQAQRLVAGNLERARASPFFKNLKLFGASVGLVTLSWFMATGPLYGRRVDSEWEAKKQRMAAAHAAEEEARLAAPSTAATMTTRPSWRRWPRSSVCELRSEKSSCSS